MTQGDFVRLLDEFTRAAESGDGARFARCFCGDGVCYDCIQGAHTGRADIACARPLSSFSSRIEQFAGRFVVIDGSSRFVLHDGLVAECHESVNGGVAMHQPGVEPARMDRVSGRWTERLRARPDPAATRA